VSIASRSTISNDLTITNSTLKGTGDLVISGLLTLNGGLYTTGTTDAEGGIALGSFDLAYGTLNNHATATWTGGNSLIEGNAVLNNLAGATFAVQTTAVLSNGQTASAFNNAGNVTVSTGGTAQVLVTFNNSGALQVSSGSLALGVGGSGSGNGSFSSMAGAITFDGGFTLDSGTSITAPELDFNTPAWTAGPFQDAGSYTVSGRTFVAAGHVTLSGAANLSGSLDLIGGVLTIQPTSPVTQRLSELTVSNASLSGSDNYDVSGLLTFNGALYTTGTTDAEGGIALGSFDLAYGTLNNHATATWTGGNSLIEANAVLNNLAGATFAVQTTAVLSNGQTASAIENAGLFIVSGGSSVAEGPVTFENAVGGILSGAGWLNVNITNDGVVNPGSAGAAGTLTINGNYSQTATGSLNVDLGGTAAGSSDQLAVSGTATLGGRLNVATIGSFAPVFGNTFQVLTFGSSSGNFALYTGPSLASGLFLDPVFSSTNLTLAVDRVSISGAPAFPLQGIPISLTGAVTGPSAGNSFSFSWNVTLNSNGFATGSGQAFAFTPNLNGTYVVTLAVADVFGGGGTVTLPIVVAPSIFVLNPTASGALTASGNASINIPGEVVVDSSSSSAISLSGNAQIAATVVDVSGGFRKTGNATISPAPTTGVSLGDAFAALAGPGVTGLTGYGSVSLSENSQRTIGPGIYSQISVSGNASLTVTCGTYIIEGGGLAVTGNGSISGTNVFIYNAGSNYPNSGGNYGGITLSGNGTFNLTAETSGTYAGLLVFQSRQNTRALSFSGNAMAGMTGTIYAANALLSMSGNAQLQNPLVVGTLNLSGNVSLTQAAAGSDGSGDAVGLADTLMAGNLEVYINDPSGLFSSDALGRIQDAINAWDALLVPWFEVNVRRDRQPGDWHEPITSRKG
jgi:hypothetical protein